MLLIGIDEAGYGPKLGPLCHGYAVFRSPETADETAPDLWVLLQPAVMHYPAAGDSIAVEDSKRLYASGAGLGALERGVRAFLACTSASAGSLFERLVPAADRARLEEDPWGRELRGTGCQPAPRDKPAAEAAFLQAALRERGVSVLALGARALSARHFNAALCSGTNKAEVSWSVIGEELQRLLALAAPGEDIHVTIDRQGGRKFYGAQLAALFPGALPWAESETPQVSVYRLEAAGRAVRVAFLVNAESMSLPVALASMTAKLVRELCMARLNAFFQQHMANLEPTAGYAADAQRFLRDTREVRLELGIQDRAFVRSR